MFTSLACSPFHVKQLFNNKSKIHFTFFCENGVFPDVILTISLLVTHWLNHLWSVSKALPHVLISSESLRVWLFLFQQHFSLNCCCRSAFELKCLSMLETKRVKSRHSCLHWYYDIISWRGVKWIQWGWVHYRLYSRIPASLFPSLWTPGSPLLSLPEHLGVCYHLLPPPHGDIASMNTRAFLIVSMGHHRFDPRSWELVLRYCVPEDGRELPPASDCKTSEESLWCLKTQEKQEIPRN